MPEFDALLHSQAIVVVAIIIVFAALAHGIVGFGFPMISTPVVAMMMDMRTAILVTVVPNILINLMSVAQGGNWRLSIGKYWPIAIFVLIGTVVGTRVLIGTDPEPLKLLLASMIVLYLLQDRIRKLDWSWLERHPRGSGVMIGLFAGFLFGSVNVAVPPLVIYFMALGLAPVAMTQILNLCFFVGKSTQLAALGISGHMGLAILTITAPLALIAVVMLRLGMRIQRRIPPGVYQAILRKILGVMAAILVIQVGWHYMSGVVNLVPY